MLDYAYPEVKFLADVSSGTYIRSLVEDIGQAVKSGAYTTTLRRTKVGRSSIEASQTLENIKAGQVLILTKIDH